MLAGGLWTAGGGSGQIPGGRCCKSRSGGRQGRDSTLKAYVAVTDKKWFDHLRGLSRRQPVEEVNFWTPKPWGGEFGVLSRGQPLLFKLRSPHNANQFRE